VGRFGERVVECANGRRRHGTPGRLVGVSQEVVWRGVWIIGDSFYTANSARQHLEMALDDEADRAADG